MDFLLVQSVSGLMICHVLEHVMCQVTYPRLYYVRPGYMIVYHMSLISQNHVMVLLQDLLIGVST